MKACSRLNRNRYAIDKTRSPLISRVLLLLALFITMVFVSPSQGEIEINVTKTVIPQDIVACENATVWINVTATGEPTKTNRPLDVMIVIDRSASMEGTYNGHSTLYWIQQAAKSFVGKFNSSQDRIGLVSYHTTAYEDQELTSNFADVNTSIEDLDYGLYTNTGEGVRRAQLEISERGRSNAFKFIVLFTDGIPTARETSGTTCNSGLPSPNTYCIISSNPCTLYATNQAAYAKAASTNTTIFSLAYLNGLCAAVGGSCNNLTPNYYCGQAKTLSRTILKNISSKNEYFFEAPDPTQLGLIFDNISNEINSLAATGLLKVDFIASNFTLLDGAGGGSIQFSRSSLSLNENWNNSINITTNVAGTNIPTNTPDSYINCTLANGTVVNITLPVPTINVQLPITLEKNAPSEIFIGQYYNYTVELNNIGHLSVRNLSLNDTHCPKITYVSNHCIYTGAGNISPLDVDYYPASRALWINTTGPFMSGDRIVCNMTAIVFEPCNGTILNSAIATYDRYPCIISQSDSILTGTRIKQLCISGYKRNACDGQPLSGWKIEVFNKTTGTKMGENTTNATGYWRVCNLGPGNYWVNETLRSGWLNANPNQSVVLGRVNKTGVNFNNTPLLCISGYKRNACDGQPLSGWKIEVFNKTTGTKMGENTTNATGYWQVCNLGQGNYWVNETLKSGWQNANPNQSVVLDCVNKTGVNFNNMPHLCISGYKRNACDGQPLSGWKIEVFNKTTGTKMGENTTNATGYWQVCGLDPGNYWVNETLRSGWLNANSNQSVVLDCVNKTGVNFNNTPHLCISGYKHNACDGQPLSGWKIEVFNKTTGTKMGENTTNATGYWQVCGLDPGNYWINETLKSGWLNANSNQSVVLDCVNKTGVNFNNTPHLCISGYKHNACDGQPLSGWKIEVFNKTTGTKMGENTTNATGYWQVCGLDPGNYWVNETLKSGWQNFNPNQSAILDCVNKTDVNFSNMAPSNFTVIKTATTDTAEPGDNVTYIINVTNTGECSLSVVRVVDVLPIGLVYISDNSTTPGTVSGNMITWDNVGPLAAGASRFIEIVAKVVL